MVSSNEQTHHKSVICFAAVERRRRFAMVGLQTQNGTSFLLCVGMTWHYGRTAETVFSRRKAVLLAMCTRKDGRVDVCDLIPLLRLFLFSVLM